MRTVTLPHPFREGSSVALSPALATGLFTVGVAGRGYQLDLASDQFSIESLDFMRTQQDQGEIAGEGTLSNTSLWRRSLRSWHLGAGQTRGDEEGSSPYRFNSSRGIDPWEEWKISLLNDTARVTQASNTPIGMVVVDDLLFMVAGTTVRRSANGTTWTLSTTLSAVPTTLPVSDGEKVYVGCDDGQVRSVDASDTVTDEWALADTDVLAFAKGRLWAGALNELFPLTPGGAITAQFTHPWVGWRWTTLCEGPRAVYAGGFLGDKSQIYRVPFKTDGTGFDAAVVAASLPDGEIVRAMASYLGFILIGTNLGLRFGVPDTTGDITYGALIETPEPVTCFEPQDRFVWFGWSDYDGTATGLGRVDLSAFTSEITPAYASDLMYDGQGDVTSIVTFGDKRLFTVAGDGVIGEADVKVAAGELISSGVTFGLYDKKIASVVVVTHERLDGQVLISLSVDDSAFSVIAESSVGGSVGPDAPFLLNPIRGVKFAISLTLVGGAFEGPVVTGFVLSAKPTPLRGKKFILPLLLHPQIDLNNIFTPFDAEAEQAFLEGIVEAGEAVTVQIGTRNYQAFPVDFRFVPYRQSDDLNHWSGTFVLELDEVTT